MKPVQLAINIGLENNIKILGVAVLKYVCQGFT